MPVFLIGGSKGGIGKTLVSLALADYFEANGKPLCIVDGDQQNPDFSAPFARQESTVKILCPDLSHTGGWLKLTNFVMQNRHANIVINTAAGAIGSLTEFLPQLEKMLINADIKLVSLWPINRERTCLESLADYLNTTTFRVHAIKNLHYGASDTFVLFDGTQLKTTLHAKGHQTIDFPYIANRVAESLRNDSLTVKMASEAMPFFDRIELQRWRHKCHATFAEIIE